MKPEAVVLILNHYLTEMVDIIFTAKGTLDKFIGMPSWHLEPLCQRQPMGMMR